MKKNIHIPEPCHENWADFTPTQKGAFCQSCQIDVIDFSNKNPDQVKQILQENAGKHLCGRFRKTQLDELNDSFYAWENQSARSFQSKFLYACLVVFGMSLFTSCNITENQVLQGFGIKQTENTNTQLDMTSNHTIKVEGDTTKHPKWQHLKGKIAYDPNDFEEEVKEPQETNCEKDSTKEVELMTLGEVIVSDDFTDSTETEPIQEDTLYDDMMIDGEVAWTDDFETFVEDTVSTDQQDDSTNLKNNNSLQVENFTVKTHLPVFESKLFPNPAKEQTRVVIKVHKTAEFDIYLYAIDGKRVKNIYQGLLESGQREFLIYLGEYHSGSYLIIINGDQQKESLRLEKM